MKIITVCLVLGSLAMPILMWAPPDSPKGGKPADSPAPPPRVSPQSPSTPQSGVPVVKPVKPTKPVVPPSATPTGATATPDKPPFNLQGTGWNIVNVFNKGTNHDIRYGNGSVYLYWPHTGAWSFYDHSDPLHPTLTVHYADGSEFIFHMNPNDPTYDHYYVDVPDGTGGYTRYYANGYIVHHYAGADGHWHYDVTFPDGTHSHDSWDRQP